MANLSIAGKTMKKFKPQFTYEFKDITEKT